MAKGNNALLIFDFDQTITNAHMHNAFFRLGKVDFNPTQSNAVMDADINGFLQKENSGIKNAEKLRSVLQSAISNGIEVNIASFTSYPNAVRRVVKNHLGLSEKQAENISVFGGFPKDYDAQLQELSLREQQYQVGKNLHICKAIVKYKDKHGQLPKTVMLVDDDTTNTKKIKNFVGLMSTREGWLKGNGLSIEDIDNIKFEDAEVLDKNASYLKKVQEFISANLVQEPIYENLKKEEPIYQNPQDIKKSSFQEKPPQLPPKPGFNTKIAPSLPPKPDNSETKPPLPPKKSKLNKVHTDSGVAVNGKNKEQVYTQNFSSREQTEADHRDYIQPDLRTDMQKLHSSLQEDHFPKKDFASNDKGEDPQLNKKISELLNVNLQKTDINSNYVTINQSEGQQAAASPRRYIKVTQDKNIGSNPTGIDKREKGKKTDLGSKILNYVPWRTALTLAAFAIPVAGLIAGTAIGAFMYGNYRNNNRTENSAAKKENRAESAKPSFTKEFLFRAGTIAIGFLFGGPIGVVIALGIVAVDVISNGKLIQGAEKVLDAGYDALSAVGGKMLNAGKTAFSKIKETQELSKRDIEVSDHNHSSKSHVTSEDELKDKSQVKAELKRRANAASQEQSVGR